MSFNNFDFNTSDGHRLVGYIWPKSNAKANILIVHGMSEHCARYDHFASFLNDQGYGVYSVDLRGHGKTAGSLENVGFFAMKDGWQRVTKDICEYAEHIKQVSPNKPVILLGHSMGSLIARHCAFTSPELFDGYIFSATAGDPGMLGTIGSGVSKMNIRMMGPKNRSKLLTKMAFGDYNKKFKPKKTEKDWLSRDESVTKKYMDDEYCMQIFTAQFFNDLLYGVIEANRMDRMRKMNMDTPILLFAGDMDPVGEYGKGPKAVFDKMNAVGVTDLSLKMYKDGRHEMLNEINKQEVYEDVVGWLGNKIGKRN